MVRVKRRFVPKGLSKKRFPRFSNHCEKYDDLLGYLHDFDAHVQPILMHLVATEESLRMVQEVHGYIKQELFAELHNECPELSNQVDEAYKLYVLMKEAFVKATGYAL